MKPVPLMSLVLLTAFFITTWEAHPDSHLTSNLEVVMYTTGDSNMVVNRILNTMRVFWNGVHKGLYKERFDDGRGQRGPEEPVSTGESGEIFASSPDQVSCLLSLAHQNQDSLAT